MRTKNANSKAARQRKQLWNKKTDAQFHPTDARYLKEFSMALIETMKR